MANTDSNMGARTEDCIVMLPTGNRTGSVKLMSIKTGKLVTRDQFKLLPMPSTVIARLNEMAAGEGRKIGTRSNMVYREERGLLKDNVTYIRPAAESSVEHTLDSGNNTVGRLADNDIELQPDFAHQQESYSAEDIERDILDMDLQSAHNHPPRGHIEFSADDLDVGSLVEFHEPAPDTHRHPDASVPVTPPRSGGNSAMRSSARRSAAQVDILPLRRNLLDYYQPGDTAVLVKEYAINITVKEALRSRGAEASHTERARANERQEGMDTRTYVRTFEYGETWNYPFTDVPKREILTHG